MTQQFDELAMKVAEEVWGPMYLDVRVFAFARRLREEWVKGLEPVIVASFDDEGYLDGAHFRMKKGMPAGNYKLYTLEELSNDH